MPIREPMTPALLADPTVFQLHRLPPHAALELERPGAPLCLDLSGEWDFRYAETLSAPFSAWGKLTVPGFIQMQSLHLPGRPKRRCWTMPIREPMTPALLADPTVFQLHRLPPHAALELERPGAPLCLDLSGEWDFRYAETLSAPFSAWGKLTVPGFIQMQSLHLPGRPYGTPHYVNTQYPWDGHEETLSAPFSAWGKLTVPGFIQMQSLHLPGRPYGTPHYVNTQYPWDGHEALHPGQIPEQYNPIGEYQRSFTLPAGWENCFIRLEGADSAAAVWCNDQFVGYSEDSFTPAEFDLSATVRPGENTLTIQVYRFCSGSWLEDQDFWRMSGLFRPVKLFTKPVVHLEDIAVRQTFAPDVYRFCSGSWLEDQDFWRMSGLFRPVKLFTKPVVHLEDIAVRQTFAPDLSQAVVTFDCKVSGTGQVSVVFHGETQTAPVGTPAQYSQGVVFGQGEADPDVEPDVQPVCFRFTVDRPALWSAEQPELYTAEICLEHRRKPRGAVVCPVRLGGTTKT